MVILHADFGWFEQLLETMNKNQFLKFAYSEIRKVPYENLTFFLGNLYQKTFLFFNSDYNGDIPYRIRFDMNNSLNRWKKTNF